MGDIKADTQRIRECSRALQRIYDEFTKRANPADGYSLAELGDSRITDAFDDFGSNWKLHRKDLEGKIRTLGTITQAAADTYEKVDSALADALRHQDQVAAHEKKPG